MLPITTSQFYLHDPRYLYGTKGLQVKLEMFCKDVVEEIYVYRSDRHGPLFPNRTAAERATTYVNHVTLDVEISENLEFWFECWKRGTLLERKYFHLIVCAEKDPEEKMSLYHGAPADIACQKFNAGHGETLQVLKLKESSFHLMILDTNVSLEIIPDEMRNRVMNKGSLIHFSDVSAIDSGVYSCVVWHDNQCKSYKDISLDVETQNIFLAPGESFTLPCIAKNLKPDNYFWFTPNTIFHPEIKNKPDRFEMLNEAQTGNYSLVISHLTLNDTGKYTCMTIKENLNVLNLFVCSDLQPINMTFSSGDSVELACHPDLSDTFRVQWFWEDNQSFENLLMDSQDGFVNEKMKNRLQASNPRSYINISELSITDGGSYWCRVWNKGLCFKRRVHLTYVAHHEDTL